MPLQKLQFRPGVNREGTDYSNEGGWYDCNKIRFRSGFPEKLGGWGQLSPNQYLGVCRNLWNWVDLTGNNFLGVGTNIKYYIYQGGTYNDITPYLVTSSSVTITTNGTTTVTITDGAYNPSVGDYIVFGGTYTVGGYVFTGEYIVKTVPSSTTYTITATSAPTAAGPTAAVVSYEYPIGNDIYTVGIGWGAGPWGGMSSPVYVTLGASPFAATSGSSTVTVTQTGHGMANGTYVVFSGATTFAGIPASMLNSTYVISSVAANTYQITLPSSFTASSTISGGGTAVIVLEGLGTHGWGLGYTSGVGVQLRLWSSDNYGQDLALAPRGGPIYYWQDINGVGTRAVSLAYLANFYGYSSAAVPVQTLQILSAPIQQFLIAMGSNSYSGGGFNPLLVRWSDQANQYQWVPAVTNQSGEFALTNGSQIIGARTTRQEILIWTDSALYSMQYLGAPYVWGFQVLMDNISIMSPNAMITINNVTYWMGANKFYMYSGTVQTLPCAVRQYIFENLNTDQSFQIFSGANEGYNEVWWFYCSQNSTQIDSYVIYNYLDQVWYYGTMGRTAWIQNGIEQYPIAADYNRRLLNHEFGVDDNSTSVTLPIDAYVQSSDFDIGDGHNFGFVWRILPDVNFNGSNVNQPSCTMTVKPRVNSGTAYGQADNPTVRSADNYSNTKLYNIQQFTGQVYTRLRGRQLAFRIESDSIGVAWQLGSPRIDIRPDGRR